MTEVKSNSDNGVLSRRDFLEVTSASIAGLFLPQEILQTQGNEKETYKEIVRYEPILIQKSSKIEVIPPVEGDIRLGANRVFFDKNGGSIYFKNNNDDYQELEVFGVLLPFGNPNMAESWQLNKKNGLQGTELFWIWEHPKGTIESQTMKPEPAVKHLVDSNVVVFPDIKYSICDVVKNLDGNKELVFSKARLEKLLEITKNNVLGFIIDEPVEGLEINENLVFDQVKFIQEYGKVSALPIHIIAAGKQNFDFVQKLIKICNENNVPIIGGSDVYPFIMESYSDFEQMSPSLKIQPSIWNLEYLEENGTSASCLVLAAHDQYILNDKTVVDTFHNMETNGNYLPININVSGFAKLKIWEIITALSINPKYSRISWWTFPSGTTNVEPYSLTVTGIKETINILTPAIPFISGKTHERGSSNNVDYSIKKIKTDSDIAYKAAFIHVNETGLFPRVRLDSNTNYIDIISNKAFKTNLLGFLIPHKQPLAAESVLCLVPAKKIGS